jgi:hypothetical protein
MRNCPGRSQTADDRAIASRTQVDVEDLRLVEAQTLRQLVEEPVVVLVRERAAG